MTDRRYDDHEVEAIFRAAADGRATRHATNDTRLSLAELQQIGLEAGLSPEAVSIAAAALDVRKLSSSRNWLGLPVSVAHTVDLGRSFSDAEWQQLLARVREIFDAHGKSGTEGATRYWRNGNLRVVVEPSPNGDRLHFRTLNEAGRAMIFLGLTMFGVAAATAIAVGSKGAVDRSMPGILFMSVIGSGALILSAVRLPAWARLRTRQMEALGDEAAKPR